MEPQLKQRVVGASVLVVIAVVVLPMILSGPPSPQSVSDDSPVAVNPGASADTFSSRIVPRPARERPTEQIPNQAGRAAVSSSPPGTVRQEQAAAAARISRNASEQSGVPSSSSAGGGASPARGWAVQLGAFAKASNALALRDRLKAKGYSAFVEAATQRGQRVTKVLVGPSPDHERAQAELQALRRATNLRGFLVRYPPAP